MKTWLDKFNPPFFLVLLLCSIKSFSQCINSFPHVEDFETAPTWTAYTAPTSSVASTSDWTWGTPNHTYVIKSAGSGSKCWSTGTLSGAFYNFWEQSYIVSPCYDFTNLKYPHIKFKLFYDTEYHYDGGNLQYSLNGGVTWVDVGTCNGTTSSPVPEPNDCNTQNWYNYPGINYLNNPSGFVTSRHGWCGNVEAGGVGWDPTHSSTSCVGGNGPGQWLTAEHCLTGCAGQSNVIFRFTFGAGYSCNNFDGFAIDSVAVSNGISNSATVAHTCAGSNSVNFTASPNACPTNTFSWDFGDPSSGTSNTSTAQNPSHTFSGPGTYTVTLIASGGACNPPDTIKQTVNIMSVAVTSFTNVTCNGASNGAAVATVTSGLSPLNYTWSPSGGNAATATGLSPGNYTISVSNTSGCPVTATVSISQPPVLIVTPTQTNTTCSGANGVASVSVSGGTAAYSYSWSPSGGNSSSASGLAAGNYTCTVTDANGCTKTQAFTITQPASLTVTSTQTNITCNGSANGAASVTVSGGTAAYSYTWSPSGGNTSSASGLPAGNYTCTIKDANGCTKSQAFVISQPAPLNAVPSHTNVACNGASNGAASVSVSGGTGAYTYSWVPSGGSASATSGLSAGNYSVMVTDAAGCTITASASITQPPALTVTLNNAAATCGASNGSATSTVRGGTGAYTYSWAPSGGSASAASGLSTGTYTLYVADASGCPANGITTISASGGATVSITSTSVTCNGAATGAATASASGGAGAYTYSWTSSGGNSSTASGLAAGNYTIAVTDGAGCVTTASVSIAQPPALTVAPTQTNIACNGGNGAVFLSVSGGTPAYSYTWSPSGGNSSSASALPAGNYTCAITDANGCAKNQTFAITQPPALAVTISNAHATCGASNGSASASVSGGTGSYSYTWSPSGGNSNNASGLAAGNYTLAVTDANGCTITKNTSIANTGGASVTVTSSSVNCNGGTNGTASATASGGAGSYTYSWTPSGESSAIASGLAAGIYTVSVIDGAGCISTATTSIAQPPVITANMASSNVSCFGGNNGSATVTASGGTGTFTYSWSPSGGTSPTVSGLSAGNYSVSVTDGNGCSISSSIAITQPVRLAVNTNTIAATCNGSNNGSAAATVSGGTTPFIYSWSAGGSTPIVTNLAPGTYTVLVTDSNGCTQPATAVIPSPPPITISITNTSVTCGANNGTANATVAGGTAPYSYQWQPAGGTASNASGLSAGIYTLTVTDNNGCRASDTTLIRSGSLMTLSMSSTHVNCNGGNNGTASVSVSGGSAPYSYLWSGGMGTSANAGNLSAGGYTVTVTDANGCKLAGSASIIQPPPLTLGMSGTTICFGQATVLHANASGGTAPYQYSLNGGAAQTSGVFSVSPASTTSYTIACTDNNGCPSAAGVAAVNVLPPLQVVTGDAVICPRSNATLSALASGGNGNYSYIWMPGNLTGNSIHISPQANTIYTVLVSDGCTTVTASDTGMVTVVPVPVLTMPPPASGCVPLCINFNVASAPGITAYQWNFGDNNSSSQQNTGHCYTSPGIYTASLTYTTTHGCVNTITSNGMANVYGNPHAGFTASPSETMMPESQIYFYNESTGNIHLWQWSFGDGSASTTQNPTHTYQVAGNYFVNLLVTDLHGCKDSTLLEIKIKEDFTFYAPNAFTPDGDGLNETFMPRGVGWDNSTFKLWVFDRWGNQVIKTSDVTHGWDGMKNGQLVQEDVYVWEVELNDIYGIAHKYNGIVSVVR